MVIVDSVTATGLQVTKNPSPIQTGTNTILMMDSIIDNRPLDYKYF
ncbi:hypothetical protein [Lactiplantibacillus pentosus]|nr:hypothetical protein [Lactiplantibacillus pentosus]